MSINPEIKYQEEKVHGCEDINEEEWEELENEIMTFDVVKKHERTKNFAKYNEQLIKLVNNKHKFLLENIFTKEARLRDLENDIEFQINIENTPGTTLYFREKAQDDTAISAIKNSNKFEYIGSSIRKMQIELDSIEPKLQPLLASQENKASQDVDPEGVVADEILNDGLDSQFHTIPKVKEDQNNNGHSNTYFFEMVKLEQEKEKNKKPKRATAKAKKSVTPTKIQENSHFFLSNNNRKKQK